jgi:hypothetical protein
LKIFIDLVLGVERSNAKNEHLKENIVLYIIRAILCQLKYLHIKLNIVWTVTHLNGHLKYDIILQFTEGSQVFSKTRSNNISPITYFCDTKNIRYRYLQTDSCDYINGIL